MTFKQPAGPTAGILLYSIGVFFFALNDAIGKWLVTDYSVGQVMALRGAGALIVLAPMLWINGAGLRFKTQGVLHVARILCSALDTYAFYYATKQLPLADVMTFYLAAPLIIVALSATFLGERVGAHRWVAVVVGFGGVLIALHPTGAAFSWSALIALAGASMFAMSITITRRLRETHWLTLVAFQVVGSGVAGVVMSPTGWVDPPGIDLALMFLVGIVSMACFMCVTKSLAITSASLLAPFQYMSIVWAAILGWMIWGDIPSKAVILGGCVIIASGLVVVSMERPRALA